VLAPSADGRTVIVLLPVKNIPLSWVNFETPSNFKYLRVKPNDPYETSSLNPFRLVQYTLVDTFTGKTTPLIQAPNGNSLYSEHMNGAVWSSSGNNILLMNTFLPLDDVDAQEQAQRRYPCLAAVVTVPSLTASCVAFGSYGYSEKAGGPILEAAAFGQNEHNVIITTKHQPDGTESKSSYHFTDGHWQLVKSWPTATKSQDLTQDLSLTVKEDINTPPAVWATDRVSKITRKIWDPNPQLANVNLGKASVVQWKDDSDYQWNAELVTPPNYVRGKRYPLVIQTHGVDFDEFFADGIFTTAFAARPLASAGIVVLQMPINGLDIVSAREIPNQLRGFRSAIALLDRRGLIDPKKVGIIGFSRTCYYTEGALIRYPKLFAAASITDGVDESYMQYLLAGAGGPLLSHESEQIYGATPFGDGLAVWVKEAPSFNLNRVETPLLITTLGRGSILGEWEIYASLRMQKKPVDLMYLPQTEGYQHILQRPLERSASQQSNVDWFRFWLQGYEDPDPAKAAQYARWRALRKLQQQE
jgi:hypothetical protein